MRQHYLPLIAILGLWVLVLVLLNRGLHLGRPRAEPSIPVFPRAGPVRDSAAPNAGWHSISYRVETESYPSLAVYHFYSNQLEPAGWTLHPPTFQPSWNHQQKKGELEHVFAATWVDREKLRTLVLELWARERLTLDPSSGRVLSQEPVSGIQVRATLSRRVILSPRREPPRTPGAG